MKKYSKLSAIILTAFLLTACSPKEAVQEGEDSALTKLEEAGKELKEAAKSFEEKEATSELGSKTTYSIGDKITFEKSASITITGVAYTDERNQFDESNPDKVLVVTYDVENLSDKDYYVGSELELYVGGKKMETYPVGTTIDTISSGRSFEGASKAFGIIGEGDYELEVEPSISFNTKPAIVTFTVQ